MESSTIPLKLPPLPWKLPWKRWKLPWKPWKLPWKLSWASTKSADRAGGRGTSTGHTPWREQDLSHCCQRPNKRWSSRWRGESLAASDRLGTHGLTLIRRTKRVIRGYVRHATPQMRDWARYVWHRLLQAYMCCPPTWRPSISVLSPWDCCHARCR